MNCWVEKSILGLFISLMTAGASATPVITRVDFSTDNIGPNATFGLAANTYLHLDTTVTSPDLPSQMSATATYSLTPFTVLPLNFYSAPIFAEKNFDRFFRPTSLTSAWNLVVTDSSGPAATDVFPAIADPEFVPLVLNLRVVQNGTTPLIVWNLPDLSNFDIDRINVRATDGSTRVQIFQSVNLAPSTTSFTFPSGVLELGKNYEFRVLLVDLTGTSGDPVRHLENRSDTFTGLVTIPEPGTLALLGLGLAGLAASRRRKQ